MTRRGHAGPPGATAALPKISVVMGVYNGERYLREAIDSVLGQDYPNFEFIIINDGSTDSSGDIARSYRDARISVVDNDRTIGLAKSLNRGLIMARGELIARQDDDDVSMPDRFARQVAFFEANPTVALLGSAHTEIDENGRVLEEVDAHCDHAMITWSLLFFCPFVHSSVMFRRAEVVENVGLYDPGYHYSMDFEFWTRISARYRVANLPERLVRYRVHTGSMTATFGTRTREGHRLRVTNVARLLGREAWADREKDALHARLSALLFGPWAGMDVEQVPGSVDDVLRLQDAFARDQGLSPAEAAAHRYAVRQHTVRAVLELGRARSGGTRTRCSAWLRLGWRALRLYGRRMARPRNFLAVTGLVVRGCLTLPAARLAARARHRFRGGRS